MVGLALSVWLQVGLTPGRVGFLPVVAPRLGDQRWRLCWVCGWIRRVLCSAMIQLARFRGLDIAGRKRK